MEMALFHVLLFLIVQVTNSNAGIIFSSGLQRMYQLETCVFVWELDETIVSYNFYNQTTGSQTPLSSRASSSKVNGMISLAISRIRLWDAGNYSLRVTTVKSTYVDATACLFIYGSILGSVNLTVGTNPATEGDTVELTCNLASTSLPASYRPEIYYTWSNWGYGEFQNTSCGTAVLSSGDFVPGYAIKNNGRTLHISSVRYPDDRNIYCSYNGSERPIVGLTVFSYYFEFRHRPYISSSDPASKKFAAVFGTAVNCSLTVEAIPPILSITDWTFVNSTGIAQDLPPESVAYYDFYSASFRFNFTSAGFYGSYSITMTNAVGSTTTTFQVLPPGPPDAPSNLELVYVSHRAVSFQLNVMWSNTVDRLQIFCMRLRLSDTNADVQTFNSSLYYESFNATYSNEFTDNIQPLTNYIVSVWSVNSFGSSEVVEMKVRTRGQTKLSVSPQMISIVGTQAIINFMVELGENAENISRIYAKCCSAVSGQCAHRFMKYASNQIAVNDIPNGTDYLIIEVSIYSGIYDKYNYFSDTVKGVKVSRTENDCDDRRSLFVAVIVLACLLGVAVVALLAILIAYLVKTSGQRRQPAIPPPITPAVSLNMTRPRGQEARPPSNDADVCEPMDMGSSKNNHYSTGVSN